MSKASLVFATLLIIPTLGISSTQQAPAKPGVTAPQFVKSYVKAMNRADVGSMMKMFSTASGVTSIGDGTISHGWHSIQTDAQQFVGRQGTFKFTVGAVEVTPLGTGYVLAVAPLTVQTLGQDEDVEVPAAMTFVLQREGSSWKVIHEHWSSKDTDSGDGDDPGDDDGDGGDNFDGPSSSSHDPGGDLTSATPRQGHRCAHRVTRAAEAKFADLIAR
jgi:ketosteroid isomerase-like protein